MFGNEYENLFLNLREEIIDNWFPQRYPNELGYHEDLHRFLKTILRKDRKVFREHGINKADLVIDGKIGIEIKKDLKHKSKVDRCVTQVKRMRREHMYIFVIVVGDNIRESTYDDLRNELEEFLESDDFMQQNPLIKLIRKDPNDRPKRKNNDFGFGDIGDLF